MSDKVNGRSRRLPSVIPTLSEAGLAAGAVALGGLSALSIVTATAHDPIDEKNACVVTAANPHASFEMDEASARCAVQLYSADSSSGANVDRSLKAKAAPAAVDLGWVTAMVGYDGEKSKVYGVAHDGEIFLYENEDADLPARWSIQPYGPESIRADAENWTVEKKNEVTASEGWRVAGGVAGGVGTLVLGGAAGLSYSDRRAKEKQDAAKAAAEKAAAAPPPSEDESLQAFEKAAKDDGEVVG
jgi:hypothetical protein